MSVDGFAAPGYEEVRTEFERNFSERGDVGAAFAATRDGALVVDLYGGWADSAARRPWREDTLQVVFSGTKGLVAMCVLLCVERGTLELDAPVSRYWPEFGKDAIRVRDVVSHTSRLPGIDAPTTFDELLDDELVAARLAQQAPSDDPRTAFCYHALTYGWLCGELVRRADGRSVGRFFRDEIAEPLDLEIWIGLPAELEDRVSRIELHPTWPAAPSLDARAHEHDPLLRAIWGNPPTFARDTFAWNDRGFHAAEIPGAGGIATARDMARLYGQLDRVLGADTVALARTELAAGWDEAHGTARRYGVGFALQTDERNMGPVDDAFGHGGAGGSRHGAWPSRRVGFSYAMNLMRDDQAADPRVHPLLNALERATR